MADLSILNVNSTNYNIKDATARQDIASIKDGQSIDSFADVENVLGDINDVLEAVL